MLNGKKVPFLRLEFSNQDSIADAHVLGGVCLERSLVYRELLIGEIGFQAPQPYNKQWDNTGRFLLS